ncbi:MAG: FN3 associated domain-containing protein [Chthoniobacteraceae bacterium]
MDPLQHLQLDIVARLMAEPYFGEFAIFVMRPRQAVSAMQIQELINNSLAGVASGNGISIEVLMPLVDRADEESGILLFEPRTIVRVKEYADINMSTQGTQVPCEEIALQVCVTLEGFLAQGYGGSLYIPKEAIVPCKDFPTLVTYDVNVKSRFGLQNAQKAALPKIAGDHTGITLTTATAGSAIYYTTDESYPWSGNSQNPSTATLYSTPFSCAEGAIVRAAASMAGLQSSDVAMARVS